MSRLHNWLCKVLDEMGIGYNTEEPFGLYSIDCYIPDHKVAIEADGPHHRQRVVRDERRDDYMLRVHGIRTLRLKSPDLSTRTRRERTKLRIQEFLDGS